jgi:tRNA-specific 2-thiouridylase
MAPAEVVGNSARGDALAIARLVVDGERILEADAPGMRGPLAGLTLLEAAAVPGATLAADAVADALGRCFTASPNTRRVAVAMSGGVDSAVALLRAGPRALGVTLRLWMDPAGPDATRACCSPAAVIAARETCHALGLPHVTLYLRDAFRSAVVAPFVDGYANGLTPNPCSRCNGSFRFDALVDFARRAGAPALWTGHYARIVEREGVHLVARGADAGKDQSYMLATVDPQLLRSTGFPLGDRTKEQVRAEAATAGLAVAHRPESQEACFLAGDDYRRFLRRQGLPVAPGPIVDEAGTELGRHEGVWGFTPGQRRGIGISSSEPLHVLRTEPSTSTLVVGPRRSLAAREVEVEGRLHLPVDRADVKLRYRSDAVPTRVESSADGFILRLEHAVDAVAPGQVAALYVDDAVVGAGVVSAARG